MMFLGNSVEVNREQHQDWLRRAEQERLAQQAMAGAEKSSVWQSVKGRLSQITTKKEAAQEERYKGHYALCEH